MDNVGSQAPAHHWKLFLFSGIGIAFTVLLCVGGYVLYRHLARSVRASNKHDDQAAAHKESTLVVPAPVSPDENRSKYYASCNSHISELDLKSIARDAIRKNPAYAAYDISITKCTPIATTKPVEGSGVMSVTFYKWKLKDAPTSTDVPSGAVGPETLLVAYYDAACGAYRVDALAAAGSSPDWCIDYKSRLLATCNQSDDAQPSGQNGPTIKTVCESRFVGPTSSDWNVLAKDAAEPYVRRGKWLGSVELPESTTVEFTGLNSYNLSGAEANMDPIVPLPLNFAALLRYSVVNTATQTAPAGVGLSGSDTTKTFKAVVTMDDSCKWKIVNFTPT